MKTAINTIGAHGKDSAVIIAGSNVAGRHRIKKIGTAQTLAKMHIQKRTCKLTVVGSRGKHFARKPKLGNDAPGSGSAFVDVLCTAMQNKVNIKLHHRPSVEREEMVVKAYELKVNSAHSSDRIMAMIMAGQGFDRNSKASNLLAPCGNRPILAPAKTHREAVARPNEPAESSIMETVMPMESAFAKGEMSLEGI